MILSIIGGTVILAAAALALWMYITERRIQKWEREK